jgi:polygalacturonase
MQKILKLFLIACAALVFSCYTALAFSTPQLPTIPARTLNIMDFGAVGDGIATNTTAVQAAIDKTSAAGGGTVEVPSGTFLCGPVQLASCINLYLDAGAVLLMLPLEKYPGGTSHPNSFISGSELHDVTVSGSGMINGQGIPWWPYARVRGARRPIMIHLLSCHRVLIEEVILTEFTNVSYRHQRQVIRCDSPRRHDSREPILGPH